MLFGSKTEKIEKAIEKKHESALIAFAHDKDKQTRLSAIIGIGKIGTDEGFNCLIPMLGDADPDVRAASATALGELGNAHAHAHLSFHLKSEQDENVKKALQAALAKIKDKD